MLEKRLKLIVIGSGLVLSSLLWALLANGKSGYTGFIIRPLGHIDNYSYGMWKYCKNDICTKYDFNLEDHSFVMKMKSARAFYFALCPFAVAAFTGYMLALMQGNKPLVLAGVCSTIQGILLIIANTCLTLALEERVPKNISPTVGWSLILPWVGILPGFITTCIAFLVKFKHPPEQSTK
ncbi:uncharacterized protein LOC142345973 [Convolutriloba macropyga]|uniref:uncharacterized protein LOC142345973 n=1 Tax=Convolutriloba macropyga TaxID=536237 RepID=UPI003F51FC14